MFLVNDRQSPVSPRLGCQCFQVARRSHPRKPRSAPSTVGSTRKATSAARVGKAKAAVLAYVETTLARMAEASPSDHAENDG